MANFDLKTHHRDAKSGRVIHTSPYRLQIKDGQQLFERPPGSGLFFNPDGSQNHAASKPAIEAEKAKLLKAEAEAKAAEQAKIAAAEKAAAEAKEKELLKAKVAELEAKLAKAAAIPAAKKES